MTSKTILASTVLVLAAGMAPDFARGDVTRSPIERTQERLEARDPNDRDDTLDAIDSEERVIDRITSDTRTADDGTIQPSTGRAEPVENWFGCKPGTEAETCEAVEQ